MFSRPDDNIEYLDLHPGMSVLECGVGAGDYTIHLASRIGEGGHLYAADVQKSLLERVHADAERKHLTNITTLWSDLDAKDSLKKLPDASIDRVVIANILFQLEQPQNLFLECARVLKPGGLLLCIDWSESFGGIGPRPDAVVHVDIAQSLATQAGLQILKNSIDVGPHHYGFTVRK